MLPRPLGGHVGEAGHSLAMKTRLGRTYRCTRTRRSHVPSRLSVACWPCQFWAACTTNISERKFPTGTTRPADGQSNNSETLSRIQSLADYTIDTLESSFQKRQPAQSGSVGGNATSSTKKMPGFTIEARSSTKTPADGIFGNDSRSPGYLMLPRVGGSGVNARVGSGRARRSRT